MISIDIQFYDLIWILLDITILRDMCGSNSSDKPFENNRLYIIINRWSLALVVCEISQKWLFFILQTYQGPTKLNN